MNKRIKRLWVDALRSGEYVQGKHLLRDSADRFCCLGVLCNIHAQEHPKIAAAQNYPGRYMGYMGDLPRPVYEWAGLDRNDPKIADNYLSLLNDNGRTFPEIADLIEKHL